LPAVAVSHSISPTGSDGLDGSGDGSADGSGWGECDGAPGEGLAGGAVAVGAGADGDAGAAAPQAATTIAIRMADASQPGRAEAARMGVFMAVETPEMAGLLRVSETVSPS
jgi:hypothetical protein